METSRFTPKVKSISLSEEGYVETLFAVYDALDYNGDVLEKGSLRFASDELPILVNHDGIQVGVGKAENTDEGAILRGNFFLQLQAGRDAYELVRVLGEKAKWSFGFVTKEATIDTKTGARIVKEAEVFEVSLVPVPAQPRTRTLLVKRAVPYRDEGFTREGDWSRPNLSDFTDKQFDELDADERERIGRHFAWSANWPPQTYGDLKLPHHVPQKSGVGPAHWRGVVAAMAALLGARGGVDIPDADRERVYQHLARHYREAGAEPPPLDEAGRRMVEKELDALEKAERELLRSLMLVAKLHIG
jgi:HK97 family phage prohead protease